MTITGTGQQKAADRNGAMSATPDRTVDRANTERTKAVDAGVDLFDSVLPSRVARSGQVWLPGGRLNLRNAAFLDDPNPIQEDCPCPACRRFSRAYLAHLFRARELLGYRLATCHNLTFTLDFMAGIRSAIAAGRFPELVREVRGRLARFDSPDQRRDIQAGTPRPQAAAKGG